MLPNKRGFMTGRLAVILGGALVSIFMGDSFTSPADLGIGTDPEPGSQRSLSSAWAGETWAGVLPTPDCVNAKLSHGGAISEGSGLCCWIRGPDLPLPYSLTLGRCLGPHASVSHQ